MGRLCRGPARPPGRGATPTAEPMMTSSEASAVLPELLDRVQILADDDGDAMFGAAQRRGQSLRRTSKAADLTRQR